MKKILYFAVALIATVAAVSCNQKGAHSTKTTPLDDSISATYGEGFGKQFALMATDSMFQQQMKLDKSQVIKGMRAALSADTTDAGKSYMQGLQMGMQVKQMAEQMKMMYNVNIDIDVFTANVEKYIATEKVTEEDLQAVGTRIQALMQQAQQKMMAPVKDDAAAPAKAADKPAAKAADKAPAKDEKAPAAPAKEDVKK